MSSDIDSLEHLQTFLADRIPRHRRGFYLWMIVAPLTAPLMIIRCVLFPFFTFECADKIIFLL